MRINSLRKRLIDSSYLARYFLLNAVDISDYAVFPARSIENAPPEFHFAPSGTTDAVRQLLNQIAPGNAKASGNQIIDQFLMQTGTTAFLVVAREKMLFESYYNGYQRSSICTSFSTAKSFVSALIGIALGEKLIKSLDDPITR
jgi:hypothetical protein